MAATHKPKMSVPEKMLVDKRRLVKTLLRDIEIVQENADHEIARIHQRISIAKTLIAALEKGTLKL